MIRRVAGPGDWGRIQGGGGGARPQGLSLPSPTLSSLWYSYSVLRNKQIRNNFAASGEGGGGLRSLYFNYTPAP